MPSKYAATRGSVRLAKAKDAGEGIPRLHHGSRAVQGLDGFSHIRSASAGGKKRTGVAVIVDNAVVGNHELVGRDRGKCLLNGCAWVDHDSGVW